MIATVDGATERGTNPLYNNIVSIKKVSGITSSNRKTCKNLGFSNDRFAVYRYLLQWVDG